MPLTHTTTDFMQAFFDWVTGVNSKAEAIRAQKRQVQLAMMEIKAEQRKLTNREREIKESMMRMKRKRDEEGLRKAAVDLVNTRERNRRFEDTMKCLDELLVVVQKVQEAELLTQTMQSMTKLMKSVNAQADFSTISTLAKEFERELMKSEVTADTIKETLEDATENAQLSEEREEMVNKVLDELSTELEASLKPAPTGSLAAKSEITAEDLPDVRALYEQGDLEARMRALNTRDDR